MKPFRFIEADDRDEAVSLIAEIPGAQFIAGGTSQVDLMKEGVQQPAVLISVNRLGMDEIRPLPQGGLQIGANVRNTVLADHPVVRQRYTAVAEALHAGASQQIRNVASTAGNLLQRTRCPYLRDAAQRCNKRDRGSGCAAVEGFNRLHAIFGQTDRGTNDPSTCIAVHPSDLAVALAAHRAVIVTKSPRGETRIPFEDLHRLPGEEPQRDTNLSQDELITAIELPAFSGQSHYLKVRDRASYAFALVSCAVALEFKHQKIEQVTVVLGSVAAKPWRAFDTEELLSKAIPEQSLFENAADLAINGARAYSMNRYKLSMVRALIIRALSEVTGLRPYAGAPGTAFAASVGGIAGVHDAYTGEK